MNFEEYVEKEFKNGEEKFTKIEGKLDLVNKQLIDIQVTLRVDEKMRESKAKNAGMLYGGIISIVIGVVTHLLKGAL